MARFTSLNPYSTWRDATGAVVAAGTLDIFDNGTTTPINVFSDPDLTVAQSNPYTLDAYGRVIGDLYWSGAASLRLKDSGGATIRTVDDCLCFDTFNDIDDATNNGVTLVNTFTHTTSGSPANGIGAGIGFAVETTAGNTETCGAITVVVTDNTLDSEDSKMTFRLMVAGAAAADYLELSSSALYPTTTDQLSLGTATLNFSDLFLDLGAVINFDNGDVTLTHSANALAVAGGILDLSSGGAYFGTAAAANLLDDYEEGTFTPVLEDTSDNATTATENGTYTKVGNRVFFEIEISVTSLGSATGVMRLDGLPFVVNTTRGGNAFSGFGDNLAVTANAGVVGDAAEVTDHLNLYVYDATTGTTGLTEAEISADGDFNIAGFYIV